MSTARLNVWVTALGQPCRIDAAHQWYVHVLHCNGEILTWCRARDCRGIDAIALPGNRATKNFFEASGFTARMLVMHHRTRPAADDASQEPA